jgi:hypothetical protein
MYTLDFFNLGKFSIQINLLDIVPTHIGHNFKIMNMACTYNGRTVGTVNRDFQAFAGWLGLHGLDVFAAIGEELEQQEHAEMAFNSVHNNASNY